MKVVINNETYIVGWSYQSDAINKLCKNKGISGSECFKGLNKKEICELLGIKSYPLPERTHCIITDPKGINHVGSVRRYVKTDPWDRNEARRKSLDKALWQIFPLGVKEGRGEHNEEHSNARKAFWDAYNGRRRNNPMNNFLKAIKSGEFTLSDIRDYVTRTSSVVTTDEKGFPLMVTAD